MAVLNLPQIEKLAKFFKILPKTSEGMNFYSFKKDNVEVVASDLYPPINHSETIIFFFFVCLHQYGFWYGDEKGYLEPLIGFINNKKAKGSDLLFQAAMRAFNQNCFCFKPSQLAKINPPELAQIFSDDNGPIPFPDFETRFQLTRAFGKWFVAQNISPSQIVSLANSKKEQLKYFLNQLIKVSGFDKDPFQKKNLLLAMILTNRPEKFLRVQDNYNWRPIIDYHLMRLALRLGLVDLSFAEQVTNIKRNWVSQELENEIRLLAYEAINAVIIQSGQPMSFIDEIMWQARRYCPEMEKPNCPKCIFSGVCSKRIDLFQPIFRTTAY